MVNGRRKQTGQQLLLRFEEGSDLRDRLEAKAKEKGRSTTAEVLLRLKKSIDEEDAAADWELGELRTEIVSLKAQMMTVTNRLKALEDR